MVAQPPRIGLTPDEANEANNLCRAVRDAAWKRQDNPGDFNMLHRLGCYLGALAIGGLYEAYHDTPTVTDSLRRGALLSLREFFGNFTPDDLLAEIANHARVSSRVADAIRNDVRRTIWSG